MDHESKLPFSPSKTNYIQNIFIKIDGFPVIEALETLLPFYNL